MARDMGMDRLNAFVDGELTAAESAATAAALADDETARAMVEDLREASALLKAAVSEPVAAMPPERLTRVIESAWAARSDVDARMAITPHRGPRAWQLTALAASLAGILVGLTGGYFAGTSSVQRQLAQLTAAQTADRALLAELASVAIEKQDRDAIDQLVGFALEKNKSGESTNWQDPSGAGVASITPIRTFRAADGKWCREYTQATKLGSNDETLRGIACRGSDGLWRNRLQILGDS